MYVTKKNTNKGTVLLRSFCRPFGYGQPPDYILCTSSSPGRCVTRLKDKEGLRASPHTPYLLTEQNTSTWSALTPVPRQYEICSLVPRLPLTIMTAPSKVYNTEPFNRNWTSSTVHRNTNRLGEPGMPFYFWWYSPFDGAHMRRNTRLSPPAQLQCWHSGAGEPGVEAMKYVPIIVQAVHFIVHWLRNKANVVSQKIFTGNFALSSAQCCS